MKNSIISIICFLIILAVWFAFYQFSISNIYDYFEENLNKLSEYILDEDFESASSLIDTIINEWNEIEKIWVFFVHQEDIDNIITSINKVKISIEMKNRLYTLSEIEDLMYILRIVRGNESLSLENVF